ncbi:MAG: 3-oxoacyl-ACP reductase family protein [Pseudomonadota bacterium]
MNLKNKIALVTGAGAGIGRAIALRLGREGARVGVNDINEKAIDETLKRLQGNGADGLALPADVGNSDQVKKMFEKLMSTWETLDILVNNAGIAIPAGWSDYQKQHTAAVLKSLTEVMKTGRIQESMKITSAFKEEWWHTTLRIHLDGTFFCTREALKIMEEKRSGGIINMASVCGMEGCAGMPAYSAAKGGIIAFTKAIAKEVIGSGIIVNAVAPGYVDTPLLANMDSEVKNLIIAQTPAGRLGTPEEISSMVAYLASNEASFMVGQILSPNGGLVI